MQAIEVPVLKATMVAALALGAYLVPHKTHHHHHHHHGSVQPHLLVLHAPVAANSIYLTAWANGSFEYPIDIHDLKPLHFAMRTHYDDGCDWLGEETLVPDGDRYAYSYEETLLGCEPGSTPTNKTPRTGFVTIDR